MKIIQKYKIKYIQEQYIFVCLLFAYYSFDTINKFI